MAQVTQNGRTYTQINRAEFPALGLPQGCDGAVRDDLGEVFTLESVGQSFTTWRSRTTDEVLELGPFAQ